MQRMSKEEGEEAAGCCPSGPALTGLSQQRGKVTHPTAPRGPINVRPSRCVLVMADKWFSGSSHSQSTQTHVMLWLMFHQRGKHQQEQQPGSSLHCLTIHSSTHIQHFTHIPSANTRKLLIFQVF